MKPEHGPKISTFEETIGHTPLNRLISAKFIHEEQEDYPVPPEELKRQIEEEKRQFLEHWETIDLTNTVSDGRVDRAFIEDIVRRMKEGDWNDLKFLNQIIEELKVIRPK